MKYINNTCNDFDSYKSIFNTHFKTKSKLFLNSKFKNLSRKKLQYKP